MKRWLIAILLLPAGCQNAAQPVATIPGLATLRVHVVAEPKAGAPRSDATLSSFDTPMQKNTGAFTKVDYADLSQIVVWLQPGDDSIVGGKRPPVELSLRDPAPVDSVTAVASVGQQVIFKNATGNPQTFYSVSDGNNFNLGSVGPGATAQFTVKSAGTIEVLSESSTDPLAVLETAATPWIKLTRAGDGVTFSNVMPGAYTVVSWHPRLPGSQTQVQLSPDHTADVQVRVGVNALPKVAPVQTP